MTQMKKEQALKIKNTFLANSAKGRKQETAG